MNVRVEFNIKLDITWFILETNLFMQSGTDTDHQVRKIKSKNTYGPAKAKKY